MSEVASHARRSFLESARRSRLGFLAAVVGVSGAGALLVVINDVRHMPVSLRESAVRNDVVAFVLAAVAIVVYGIVTLYRKKYPRTKALALRRARSYVLIAGAIAPLGVLAYLLFRTTGTEMKALVASVFAGLLAGFLVEFVIEMWVRRRNGTWIPDLMTPAERESYWRDVPNLRMVYVFLLSFACGEWMLASSMIDSRFATPADRSPFETIVTLGPFVGSLVLVVTVWLFNQPSVLVPHEFRRDRGPLFRWLDRLAGSSR